MSGFFFSNKLLILPWLLVSAFFLVEHKSRYQNLQIPRAIEFPLYIQLVWFPGSFLWRNKLWLCVSWHGSVWNECICNGSEMNPLLPLPGFMGKNVLAGDDCPLSWKTEFFWADVASGQESVLRVWSEVCNTKALLAPEPPGFVAEHCRQS